MPQIVEIQPVLGQQVIPAVPGEFYSYSTEFTEELPLYTLMKCKANKRWSIEAAAELGSEVNLVFSFSGFQTQVRSARSAHALGLMGSSMVGDPFDEAWIAIAGVTIEDFQRIRSQKDVEELVRVCCVSCSDHRQDVSVEPGSVIAVVTSMGKYGLFLVKELTATSVSVDACHILL